MIIWSHLMFQYGAVICTTQAEEKEGCQYDVPATTANLISYYDPRHETALTVIPSTPSWPHAQPESAFLELMLHVHHILLDVHAGRYYDDAFPRASVFEPSRHRTAHQAQVPAPAKEAQSESGIGTGVRYGVGDDRRGRGRLAERDTRRRKAASCRRSLKIVVMVPFIEDNNKLVRYF